MIRKNKALSETFGTILLLGISVSLFSVVYVMVFTVSPSPISPSVNLFCSLENDNLTIEHYGGKTLSLNTSVKLKIDNTNYTITIKDYMNKESKENGVWNVGEKVVYPIDIKEEDKKISVYVIDVQSNSVILMTDL